MAVLLNQTNPHFDQNAKELPFVTVIMPVRNEADYIANSIHGQAVVLGSPLVPLQGLDLALEGVVFEHNGEIVGTYTAAEVMGNPLNALAWLANHLAVRGHALKPGDIVISGGISKLLRPKAGDCCVFCSYGSIPCPPIQAGATPTCRPR